MSKALSSVSNRVEEIGKTMDSFQRQLDTLLSQSNDSDGKLNLRSEVMELRNSFMAFKNDASASIASIRRELDTLYDDQRRIESQLEDLNQYSRRNCLLIHGIPEQPNEDVENLVMKTVSEKLKVQMDIVQIDRCHRIGAPKRRMADVVQEGKRPIIVKFISYRQRNLVWRAKSLLKGSSVLITESLTPQRQRVLRLAKDRFGFRQVWSQDGKIFVSSHGRRYVATTEEDLQAIPVGRG
mgnify:CR=1 FL=1